MSTLSPAGSIEARITARIAELEKVEQESVTQLTVIRNLLYELRTLIADAQTPAMSGDPLGVALPANGEEVHHGALVCIACGRARSREIGS